LNPESSREDHLERNALVALDAIPLESMCQYDNNSALWSKKIAYVMM